MPLGPASVATDSSVSVPHHLKPTPTANASRPSVADSAISSASATET